MKTITINVYNFNELASDAQNNARNNIVNLMNIRDIVDDCYLLEFSYERIQEVSKKHKQVSDFYNKYNSPIVENNRNITFDINNDYVDISGAIELSSLELFLLFADIEMHSDKPYLNIDTVEFTDGGIVHFDVFAQTETERKEQIKIEKRFSELLKEVENAALSSIKDRYDYMHSDAHVIDIAKMNNIMFYEDGSLYFMD